MTEREMVKSINAPELSWALLGFLICLASAACVLFVAGVLVGMVL